MHINHGLNHAFPGKRLPEPLTKEELDELKPLLLAGDVETQRRVIEGHLKLLVHIVGRFKDDDEFISDALDELIKGVKNYNGQENITNWLSMRLRYRLIRTRTLQSVVKYNWQALTRGKIMMERVPLKDKTVEFVPWIEIEEIILKVSNDEEDVQVLLLHFQGFNGVEIAEKLERPKTSVYRRLGILLRKFQQEWSDE